MRREAAWALAAASVIAWACSSGSNHGGGAGGSAGSDAGASGGTGGGAGIGGGANGGAGATGGSGGIGGSGGSSAAGGTGATGGSSATGGVDGGGATGGVDGGGATGGIGASGGASQDAGDASPDVADAACEAGYGDCTSAPGCETDLQTDPLHCGSCSTSCTGGVNSTAACSAGACVSSCNAGWADCNNIATDGCETYLSSDAQHCGTCNNNCGSEGCKNGQCAPVPGLTTLAKLSSSYLSGIAVDATNVYFTLDGPSPSGGVGSVPIAGGGVTMLSSEATDHVAVDGAYVYYTTASSLVRVPIAGGARVVLRTNLKTGAGLLVHGGNVYYADTGLGSSDGAIWSTPTGGGSSTLIAGQQGSPTEIATDGTNLYWTGMTNTGVVTSAVMTVPIAGGTATPLVKNIGGPKAIATDTTHVYWVSGDNYPWPGAVDSIPFGGGSTQVVAKGLFVPVAMATDGVNVYVSNAGGIVKAPVGGGSQSTLTPSAARGVAVDATHVYWVTGSGYVFMATK